MLSVLSRMFTSFVSYYIYKGDYRKGEEDSHSNELLLLIFLPTADSNNINVLWPLNGHFVPKVQSLGNIIGMQLNIS